MGQPIYSIRLGQFYWHCSKMGLASL
ncbi:hypothetical protein PanWU01x14_139050 [Parasponia andersonii]|uniref:Uncharacterized protein n=1 Tax=Parasponia andersonii TaxID=3476 RepID=A0A2P5CMV0_PARAD|nr:hypothetical protein PanWU01x14_139050 [Parasponia andersonii]